MFSVPNSRKSNAIWSRALAKTEATRTTVTMPITMPNTVSPAIRSFPNFLTSYPSRRQISNLGTNRDKDGSSSAKPDVDYVAVKT